MLKCRVCHSLDEHDIYQLKEMMYGYGDTFTYFQCKRCSCLQIADIPTDIAKFYPNDYHSPNKRPADHFKNPATNYLRRLRDRYALFDKGMVGKILFTRFPNQTLRPLARMGIKPTTRILDVGCGYGWELYCLRNGGFESLLGVDPFIEETMKYSNGVTILRQSVLEISGRYDLIMFHHSFEHIPNAGETLEHVSSLLSTGGQCLIRIPTVSSYAWEHYGINWVQLDAPRHLYLHSVKSMNALASGAGLTVEQVLYDSTELQFWGSEQCIRGIPYVSKQSYLNAPRKSIFSRSQVRRFKKMAEKLNQENRGDQACFYLKKP